MSDKVCDIELVETIGSCRTGSEIKKYYSHVKISFKESSPFSKKFLNELYSVLADIVTLREVLGIED
jgi:hypothetical protein